MSDRRIVCAPLRRLLYAHSASRRILFAAASILSLAVAGCPGPNNPKPPNQKTTTPVHGMITVDGKPGHGVQVTLQPPSGIDASNPTVSRGEANQEGKFEISTYGGNDGAPPGEYVLTFEWYDRTVVRIGGGDPKDMFKGKYAKSSEHKITVPPGKEPLDLGTIELSSK